MTNTPPEGFSLRDRVTFDQLPEEIRECYEGGPKCNFETQENLWLKETQAILQLGYSTDYWEKTNNGWGLAEYERGGHFYCDHSTGVGARAADCKHKHLGNSEIMKG